MGQETIKVRKIAGALGAEIEGVRLADPLSRDTVAEIRQALLDHLVIFFRDQNLTPAQYMTFARYFGEPVEYPMLSGIEGYPEIIQVEKLEHERVNFGGLWHADTIYLDRPPMGSMLLARELPPVGGDTLFANQYLAYDALSGGMKELLDGLVAVNQSAKAAATRTRVNRIADSPNESGPQDFASEHPVVRTHPETGRKALYVNTAHSVRFTEMTEEESAPMLEFLFQHQIKPEFTCRFTWQSDSLAFWDNRAAQHNPINDYHGHRRIMHRISLGGDDPQ